MDKETQDKLTEIAKKYLFVGTLETRKSDSLDSFTAFLALFASGIKDALEEAYELGKSE